MVPVNEWLESDVSGTDGVRIFWNPDEVCRFFEESTAKLARQISASSASWVISSPSAGRKRGRRTLVAGCDLMTELRIDRIDVPGFFVRYSREDRSYRKIQEAGAELTEQGVAEWLLHLNKEQIRELEQTFRWDDHSCWRKDDEPEPSYGTDFGAGGRTEALYRSGSPVEDSLDAGIRAASGA